MKKLKLNIIGCGHLGQALAKLWATNQCFSIGQVLNRSLDSSRQATDFIGVGEAIAGFDEMSAADAYLIATPDSEIINACESLARTAVLKPGDVVFHCSGALSSEILNPVSQQGAVTCSVHPVKSFADPGHVVENFHNTYCGVEGDEQALDIIEPVMQAIGASIFHVRAENKIQYHAASVIVCNYLTALMEVGIQTYQQSGMERETAIAVMQPMVRETLNNIFKLGTVDALTGPIARGDDLVVENQLAALAAWKPEVADLYAGLGAVALELAREKGAASDEELNRINDLLTDKH